MSVREIIESGANITLAISPHDLEAFAKQLLEAKEKKDSELDGLLSVESVCELLDIKSRVTLWRWEKSGYLQPILIGKTKKYKKQDVYNLIYKKDGE